MQKNLIALTLILITWTMAGQQKNFLDQPYLETSATVDTLVVPDRIYLNIFLSEKDTKNRTSVEELENKMQQVLSSLGIDTDEQLELADLSSNFKDYFLRKTGVLKSKVFILMVDDALLAGQVIQGLESRDIANVRFQRAELSTLKELQLKLRGLAVAAAKRQAEVMLEPLGQQLGKAIHIADQHIGIFYGRNQRAGVQELALAKADSFEPLDVDFQKIKVSSTVNVKFAIQ